ncbi:LacI family DNA-binding transcriptional regulator [Arthrobacter sp. M-10]|uniref:LacI family DNA-binding transcriptional regulator n=1 Tax=Arthrobacter sp. M-10 TaxID=3233037 RepID=UPI003F8DF64A
MLNTPSAPTILDVAARAGVSKSVVSRVLRGEPGVAVATRDKVRAVAEELGYVVNSVAQSMVTNRTRTIGVFVRDASAPFYSQLLTSLQEQAAIRGYGVVTATGAGRFAGPDEKTAIARLVSLRVEGLVVSSGLLPSELIAQYASRIPIVLAGRPEQNPTFSSIYCDENVGGAAMADHIAALGHTRVAVLALARNTSIPQFMRSEAMIRRLGDLNIETLRLSAEEYSEARIAGAPAVVSRMLKHPEYTALLTPSDRWAIAVLENMRSRNLTAPGHLSVTGYDGIWPFTTDLIGLTTWRQPVGEIGVLAVNSIADQIEGALSHPIHQSLNGELIVGRTSGPPPIR